MNPYGFIIKKFDSLFSRCELTSVEKAQKFLYLNKQYGQKGFCFVDPLKSLETAKRSNRYIFISFASNSLD